MGDVVTTALSVISPVVGIGLQMNEAHQARKAQKTQQRNQRREIARQEADALETRKRQINQMREQMNIGGYQTSTQQSTITPIKGTLGDKLG